jgi:hypothetical protein
MTRERCGGVRGASNLNENAIATKWILAVRDLAVCISAQCFIVPGGGIELGTIVLSITHSSSIHACAKTNKSAQQMHPPGKLVHWKFLAKSDKEDGPMAPRFEYHFAPDELAKLSGIGADIVQRPCEREPEVR